MLTHGYNTTVYLYICVPDFTGERRGGREDPSPFLQPDPISSSLYRPLVPLRPPSYSPLFFSWPQRKKGKEGIRHRTFLLPKRLRDTSVPSRLFLITGTNYCYPTSSHPCVGGVCSREGQSETRRDGEKEDGRSVIFLQNRRDLRIKFRL